jgi:hypothetical protein
MHIRTIKNIVIGGIAGAAMGLCVSAVVNTVITSQKSRTPAPLADNCGPNDLACLPARMQQRIDFLLQKEQLPCGNMAKNRRYVHEEALLCNGKTASFEYRVDLPEWEQLGNCHAAAFWAATGAGGLENQIAMAYPECLPELLGKYGYSRIADAIPSEGFIDQLRPGDFLMYMLVGDDTDFPFQFETGFSFHVEHSAIYLGKIGGLPLVFEKRGMGCGEDHKFSLGFSSMETAAWKPTRIMVLRRPINEH